jgi:two-component system sensor histidine kinase PhoQ
VEIAPLVAKIVTALAKVYADKGVRVALEIEPDARFHGDAGDLTEMLGNLLDNAHKWCRSRVRLRARRIAAAGALPATLEIAVEDDGPGVPEELKAQVLQRGARADESTPGHGLGLAMVQDTVTLYGGDLHLERSEIGGLAVRLRFPQTAA